MQMYSPLRTGKWKQYFTQHIINLWNSQPQGTVMVGILNYIEKGLEKFKEVSQWWLAIYKGPRHLNTKCWANCLHILLLRIWPVTVGNRVLD